MMNLRSLAKSNIEFLSTISQRISDSKLEREKYLVSVRLKEQSVVGGWWCGNNRLVRRLSRDENLAYYSLNS